METQFRKAKRECNEIFPSSHHLQFCFPRQGHVLFILLRLLPLKIVSLPGTTSPYGWVPAMGYAKVSLGPQNLIPIAVGIRDNLGSEWVMRVLPVNCEMPWMCAGGFVSSALAT